MASSLLPRLLLLLASSSLPATVHGDSFDDLWSQYVQQTEAKKYESTVSRRERNLDHWDVPTAAAYLGLHPETLTPLPKYASESSTATAAAADTTPASSLTDEYIGHDAAILFYAQWCNNCHAVAPSWDAIATHVNAGTRSSNLVMALFDCEKNTKHTELCLAAGIKAYPTIMFVGSGEYHDTDVFSSSVLGKDRSAGPFGATTLPRTVKFQGNWQYGDQILDWVNIMKGLSSWHSVTESGPLRGLRNGLFRFITGGKYKPRNKGGRNSQNAMKEGSLPVGVPPNFQTELRGMIASGNTGGGSSTESAAASAQEVKDLKLKLNATIVEKELYEKAVTHSSTLLEGLLFPKHNNNNDPSVEAQPHRDPFTILTNSDGWYKNATSLPAGASNDEHPSILRACTLELTIDYCSRITTRETNTYLQELAAIPESDPFPSLEEIEKRLLDEVEKHEPYCATIESCIVSNFEDGEVCRPAQCPFENERACNYLESCLEGSVQDEYGIALGLMEKGETVLGKDWKSSGGGGGSDGSEKTDEAAAAAGVGGWGIPV